MKEYIVKVNGIEHTMQLDAEDAKRLKATEIKAEAPADVTEDTKEAAPAENKSVRAANK